MTKTVEKFIVYGFRETYHELGQYELKVVLNSKMFKNSHHSELMIFDSDGTPMKTEVKKWGRKMNCSFVIDENVADGLASLKMVLVPDKGTTVSEHVHFWVIKP